MVMTNNHLTAKIESYLLPLIGELLTAATLKVQCEKIGTTTDNLSITDLPILVPKIEQALIVFLGLDRAQKVGRKILEMNL